VYLQGVADGTCSYGPISANERQTIIGPDVGLVSSEIRVEARVAGKPRRIHNLALLGTRSWLYLSLAKRHTPKVAHNATVSVSTPTAAASLLLIATARGEWPQQHHLHTSCQAVMLRVLSITHFKGVWYDFS
jgi:hypothetical protein